MTNYYWNQKRLFESKIDEGTLSELEAVGMFSEALRILDENTVKLMIEQQKEEIARVEAELADKNAELADKDMQIEKLIKELEKYRKITDL